MTSRYELEVLVDAPISTVAARVPPPYARLEATPEGVLVRDPADDLELMATYLAPLDLPFRILGP